MNAKRISAHLYKIGNNRQFTLLLNEALLGAKLQIALVNARVRRSLRPPFIHHRRRNFKLVYLKLHYHHLSFLIYPQLFFSAFSLNKVDKAA